MTSMLCHVNVPWWPLLPSLFKKKKEIKTMLASGYKDQFWLAWPLLAPKLVYKHCGKKEMLPVWVVLRLFASCSNVANPAGWVSCVCKKVRFITNELYYQYRVDMTTENCTGPACYPHGDSTFMPPLLSVSFCSPPPPSGCIFVHKWHLWCGVAFSLCDLLLAV